MELGTVSPTNIVITLFTSLFILYIFSFSLLLLLCLPRAAAAVGGREAVWYVNSTWTLLNRLSVVTGADTLGLGRLPPPLKRADTRLNTDRADRPESRGGILILILFKNLIWSYERHSPSEVIDIIHYFRLIIIDYRLDQRGIHDEQIGHTSIINTLISQHNSLILKKYIF